MTSTITVAETAAHPTACPAFPFSRPEGFGPPAENAGLRLNEPISKVKLFNGTECWIIARHSDVREVLSSHKFSAVCHPSLHLVESQRPRLTVTIPGSPDSWLSRDPRWWYQGSEEETYFRQYGCPGASNSEVFIVSRRLRSSELIRR